MGYDLILSSKLRYRPTDIAEYLSKRKFEGKKSENESLYDSGGWRKVSLMTSLVKQCSASLSQGSLTHAFNNGNNKRRSNILTC